MEAASVVSLPTPLRIGNFHSLYKIRALTVKEMSTLGLCSLPSIVTSTRCNRCGVVSATA